MRHLGLFRSGPVYGCLWLMGLLLLANSLDVRQAQAGSGQIEYHGCLEDSNGDPLEDGTYSVRLKLYSGPTRMAPLWESDGIVTVEVASGCFTYVFGSNKSLPKFIRDYPTVWVGVAVGGDKEIFPRPYVSRFSPSTDAESKFSGHSTTHGQLQQAGLKATRHANRLFPDLYFHAGVAFGLGSIVGGESYKQIITPWQTGTGAGYGLSLTVGYRNLYQLQFRPRAATSSDLNQFQVDSVIPLDYHVKNEIVHKINLLYFKKYNTARVPVLFLTYGTASTGSVSQVDVVGTGFVDGSSKMLGLEAGFIHKSTSASFYLERRATKFQSFFYAPLGTFQEEVEANFWSVGIHITGGTGIYF